MALYMVKTVATEEGEVNWFFVSARDLSEVRAMCEDAVTHILEIIDNPADMAIEIDHEFGGILLASSA